MTATRPNRFPTFRALVAALVTAAALLLAGCSGSDSGPAEAEPESPVVAPEGKTVTEDGFIVDEVQAGDDVATQLLIRLFGFADIVPEQARACMSGQLAPLYPDGVVPADVTATDELFDALDAAAEACGVAL